jgi:hypothetical protein
MTDYKNMTNYAELRRLVAETGGTFAFSGELAALGFKALFGIVSDMGLDPRNTNELREGVRRLYNVQPENVPNLYNERFILCPNHVSDFDAVVLGLFHPHIRIVAKTDWTNNDKLRGFLELHYDLYGLERGSAKSLRALLQDSIDYFNKDDAIRHFLVFSQGTISDFNNNSAERISSIARVLSEKTGVPVVNVFTEQVSLDHPTRVVFGKPRVLGKHDDFPNLWLEDERCMQNALEPPARRPTLTKKHANNNKPGDEFF